MCVCVIIIKKENVEGTFLNGLQVDFSRSLKGKYSMKRILREIIETFEWNLVFMLREKLLNFILPFYLFKNSLILIFMSSH